MRHPAPLAAVLASVACAALAVSVTGCSKPKGATNAEQILTVTLTDVQMKTLDSGLTASGLLAARDEVAISTELNGYRVAEILVDQGATVAKGQALARLDDTLLKSQIAQGEASVAAQMANTQRAEAEAQRVAGLDNIGILPQEQIDERRIAARTAHAQLQSAKAQLADLKIREGLMVIRAPVAGRVLDRTIRLGDVASPAAVMYRMAKDGVVELNAEVPETSLSVARTGDKAQVVLADGTSVTGVVRLVSTQIDQATKLGHVRVTLPVRADIRPGGFARAIFNGRGVQVPVVPEKAVQFDSNGASLMVVDAAAHVHRVNVKTAQRANGFVALAEGPPAGTRVVLGGGSFLLDGDHVRIEGEPAR